MHPCAKGDREGQRTQGGWGHPAHGEPGTREARVLRGYGPWAMSATLSEPVSLSPKMQGGESDALEHSCVSHETTTAILSLQRPG